mgnify:CR=1 FL=1
MTDKKFFKFRLYFTATITIAIWLLLLWSHSNGGVPSHHVLNRKDLPEISNWWGGISIPMLTWFLLYRVQQRLGNKANDSKFPPIVLYAFIGALCFGILLSLFFTFGFADIPFYMMVGLLILSLFFPIYRAECFLGFVLGMTFTFGGVLPIGIVSILTSIGAILFLLVRGGKRLVTSWLTTGKLQNNTR